MQKITPLMEQYLKIKGEHQDKILLFRMGDFFEMFGEDAKKAAPILNIALTVRNKKAKVQTQMCGMPHHSISGPISKLLEAGFSVAICDQIEPYEASSKGLVKRAVTRILSPGMVYDPETIDQLKNNYVAAIDKNHISFLDISTGVAYYYSVTDKKDFFKLLNLLSPSELVVTSSQKKKLSKSPIFQNYHLTVFDRNEIKDLIETNFSNSILEKYDLYPESVKRLIRYALFMQGESVLNILNFFESKNLDQEMYHSTHFFHHLEVFKNYEGSHKDTLFSSVNRTKTPGGARCLKKILQTPLVDKKVIEQRWDKIDKWISEKEKLEKVRGILFNIGDGERKLGKVVQPTCNGRDLLAVSEVISYGVQLYDLIGDKSYLKELEVAKNIRDKIEEVIKSSPPILLKEGGLINEGVNPQLDEWMDLSKNAQSSLLKMEKEEQSKTGISSLKIRYNNIFGYYIEIRKIHSSKVPSHYRRKQTLVNVERYTTEELNIMEEKILSARSKQVEMEYQIFQDLRTEVLKVLSHLLKLAYNWSEIDVFSSLAFVAIENKYVRPQFGSKLKIVNSRHPVLEQKFFQEFVPNTIDLQEGESLILTGPNMAGKSTIMRQVALTVLLAQSGSFVPASKATMPLFHKIFTRIGAGDLLSQGLSTFMVEMCETAEILEKADSKSLIILDEIGRGTATFDGMSLAQSILEFLALEKKPILLSATHYHELTQLAKKYPSIHNGSMSIREKDGKIYFLYTLLKEPANKSYGIQVAKLAGLPTSVVNHATDLLKSYEDIKRDKLKTKQMDLFVQEKKMEKKLQSKTQHKIKDSPIIKELIQYPLFERTPMEAMNQIQKWQRILTNPRKSEVTESVSELKSSFLDFSID